MTEGKLTRRSFLSGVGALVGGGLGYALLEAAKQATPALLRPPGALPEEEFLAACIRCGRCVEACPYDTLRLATATNAAAIGTPYLIARETPCYLCQGYDKLQCIAACPTGALQPVPSLEEVHMGTAVINKDICIAWQGLVCRACWHACPFAGIAIELDKMGKPIIVEDRCVGCGLCDNACITEPSAITIVPRQAG
ncbi:MAG TPA: 4Fe-4S dicluster domain-containing protein [Anaerolineae bacterium]|nr:4Fe-4S dicluster domain-containing protein [Anaerolineae bacterium]HIQ05814.1 4Fe-4S dicluster domain-containing protein [Anaerolineae bacterium]